MQIVLPKKKNAQEVASSNILGKGWISLRKAFEVFWKRKFLVIVSFLFVFGFFCGYHYVASLQTASTIVSLDYEEASKGLTPSQTRFNIFEIQSPEVLERVIDYAGLQDTITVDEIGRAHV